ncbi:MAG TPA: YraN family protein [Acidimicrobiales bacterium]|nr:YraN family protein [Acidimicrobiales bacterium]
MTLERRALGISGEEAVAQWYAAAGYDVVARNWRCAQGELDLVCRRGRSVVFCEVKTRTTDAFGAPVEAVTRDKQMRVRRLAARWLEDAADFRPVDIRFDVASVLGGEVDVVVGAF